LSKGHGGMGYHLDDAIYDSLRMHRHEPLLPHQIPHQRLATKAFVFVEVQILMFTTNRVIWLESNHLWKIGRTLALGCAMFPTLMSGGDICSAC